jgi:NADPH-dependent 2,4-dienoyl-CoA reductase/sulfur reductase-like enzyme
MADLVIVGAGPAGLGAAAEATRAGLSVTLIDSWPAPGGQIHAKPAGADLAAMPERVVEGLRPELIEHRLGQEVWASFGDGRTLALRDGEALSELRADALVLATGAAERIAPFPGWDHPAVISAGGAQRMLKTAGALPAGRVAIAGSGPFLRTVAADLAEAGADVVLLAEERSRAELRSLASAFARQPRRAVEAAGYLRRTRRIPTRLGVAVRGFDGDAVALSDGSRVPCDALLVGFGFRPRSELARLAGCRASADGTIVDDFQATTAPGIWAAGETTGIGGAALANVEGRIAGAAAARSAGANVPDATFDRLLAERAAHRRFANALWRAWPTVPVLGGADEATTICRCEEVALGAIRAAVRDAEAASGRAAKALLRCGMGPCQGATCGEAVRAATGRGDDLDERWEPRVRPPLAPVRIGELAEMEVGRG